jgi:hypothetical protein
MDTGRPGGGGYPDYLCERLYQTDPFNYLAQRIVSLLAMKDHGAEVLELVPETFELGASAFTRTADLKAAKRDQWRYAIAESQVVLHHASETVLRLYLGHVDRPAEPWIVIAEERVFWKFRAAVNELRARVLSGDEEDRIHEVFHGTRNRLEIRAGSDPAPVEEWDTAARNIGEFLTRFAAICLDSNAYNAAKHGLVVSAGASRFQVEVDGVEFMRTEGPHIEYLVNRTDGGDGWGLQTRWVDPDHAIALSLAACHLIRQLWIVARHVYLGEPLAGFDLLHRLKLSDIDEGRSDAELNTMTINLKRPDEKAPRRRRDSVVPSWSRTKLTGAD